MKTIIMSGFGTFGNYPHNSSETIVRALHAHMLHNYRIDSIVFPATIPAENRARQLLTRAREHHASAIMSLGMSSRAQGLQVETVACNRIDDARYCLPEQVGTNVDPRHIQENLLNAHVTPWNISRWQDRCTQRNIPVSVNTDVSGGFCCNHLIYQMCTLQETHNVPWIYLHIPCMQDCLPEPAESFMKQGKVIIEPTMVIKGLELLLETASV